jgi:hypothetical protein
VRYITVLIMAVTLASALRARAATLTYTGNQSFIDISFGSGTPLIQPSGGANPWNADIVNGSQNAHQDYILSQTGFVANGNATGIGALTGGSEFDIDFSIDQPAVLHLAATTLAGAPNAVNVQFFDGLSKSTRTTLWTTTVPTTFDASLVPGHVYEFQADAGGGTLTNRFSQFSVNGELVPEPTTIALIAVAVCCIALAKTAPAAFCRTQRRQ